MTNAKYTILSGIEPKPINWLWKDRIPLEELTLFDADSATNKSSITLDLASRVSRGGVMPDNTEGLLGGVVLLQTEDSVEKTVVPRLDAAGADRSRIAIIPDTVTIPDALAEIEAVIIELKAKLLIIDPLSEFLGKNANSEQSVRQALAPLALLAERQKLAVILVRHLNKSIGQRAMYRGLGSIGIVAAARSRFMLGPNPKDPNLRVLVHTKCNLGLLTTSLLYEPVTGENGAVRIEWRGECDYRAEDVLTPPKGGHRERDAAKRFLLNILAAGPVAQKDVQAEAAKNELAWRTIERAKADLGIVSDRQGFGQGSSIYWHLPSEEIHTPPTEEVAVYVETAPPDHTPPVNSVAVYGNHEDAQSQSPAETRCEPTCADHYSVLDGDGACGLCGQFDPPPPPPPKKSPKASNTKPTKKKEIKATKKELRELTDLVMDALSHNVSGLKLFHITAKVLNTGFKTKNVNLAQAVYNVLVKLTDEKKVLKDNDTKKYSLAEPQAGID